MENLGDLQRADFEAFMHEEFHALFPDIFPLITTFHRYGDVIYDSGMADDMFRAWKAHLGSRPGKRDDAPHK